MDNFTFGKNLQQLRKKKRITQKEAADALHVTTSAVSKWENDKNEPDLQMLSKIAALYEVSVETLMTNIDVAEQPGNPPSKRLSGRTLRLTATALAVLLFLTAGTAFYFLTDPVFLVVNSRYSAEEDWGDLYEISVLWIGRYTDESADAYIDRLMDEWRKGELCTAETEVIKVIFNKSRRDAAAFAYTDATAVTYFFPYVMDS